VGGSERQGGKKGRVNWGGTDFLALEGAGERGEEVAEVARLSYEEETAASTPTLNNKLSTWVVREKARGHRKDLHIPVNKIPLMGKWFLGWWGGGSRRKTSAKGGGFRKGWTTKKKGEIGPNSWGRG